MALLPFPERSVQVETVLLFVGSAPLPVTQSARSQSVRFVIPLNASVLGHGLEALDCVGMTTWIPKKSADKITIFALLTLRSTSKL